MLIPELRKILFSGDGLDRPARRCSGPPPAPSAGARGRRVARASPAPGTLDDFLGTAVAGAGVARDRHRPVPSALVAWPLALAAARWPRHRPRRLLPADGGRVRAGVDAARAEPHRGAATAPPPFRPPASARSPRTRRRPRAHPTIL